MRITGYEDLRVQRTIKNIYAAFENLIVQKNYEKITVTELAKKAMINKKTFYRYYPTLDDLLVEMQAKYSKEYLKIVGQFQYPQDLAKSVRAFFEFSAKQDPAYEKITIAGSYNGIRQQMINTVMNKTWASSQEFKQMSDFERQILLNFVQKTGLDIYIQWVQDGKKENLDKVITYAIDLMQGGINKLLQDKG